MDFVRHHYHSNRYFYIVFHMLKRFSDAETIEKA